MGNAKHSPRNSRRRPTKADLCRPIKVNWPVVTEAEFRSYSDGVKAAYRNPRGDFDRLARVDGRLVSVNPFDELLAEIQAEIAREFDVDILPPDGSPIEETRIVDNRPVTFVRRRTDGELGLTGVNLLLPRLYFDASDEAYEACAGELLALADRLEKLAARIVDIGDRERRGRKLNRQGGAA
jgi:hypothetical protein